MIRPLSLIVLLGASAMVSAQPLYKWVEPDGAITFSITKPPAGVSYETVNPASSSGDASATGISTNSLPADDSLSKPQMAMPAGTTPALKAAMPPSTQVNQTTERIAPQVGSQANTIGISRATDTGSVAMNSSAGIKGQVSDNTAAINAQTRKKRQCEDLQKRVVSLERRLRTRLTPEDMDNTVVHMARYQRSYDQHCVQ